MQLPNDPIILLSYINTMLRDHYSSLDELCHGLSVDENEIISKLHGINYTYNSSLNKFI